jgi:TonB-linked SusC/RagA family outer membrane protein
MKRVLLSYFMMSFFLLSVAFAQNKPITGKVTSAADGLPLPGVSVTVKGNAKVGTQTDANGNFKLSVPTDAKTLVFGYIGFKSLEAPIANVVNAKMQEDQKSLSEVIVTGYGTQNRREIAGSISTIDSKEFAQVPIASFDQALQGKAPGILVQSNSGQPGSAANILIRGAGSVIGSTAPLYIVDGVEITANDFSSLNSGDFESISVLKDAISTSQYGSRGSNGVIVITTKKGKAGATRFNYDVQYGESNLPEGKLRLMNSNEKLDYELANGNPYGWTPAELTDLRAIDTNWEDVLYRTGQTVTHTVGVSGGNDKTTFFLSGSYFDQTGTVNKTGLERTTGRANIESKSGDFIFGLNSSFGYSLFTNTDENNTGISTPLNAARWTNPYETPKNASGDYTDIVSGQPNGLREIELNSRDRKQIKGVGNVYASYAAPFLKGLTFKTNLGGDFRNNESTEYLDPTTQLGRGQTGNRGSFSRGTSRYFRYTSTSSVNYKTIINKDHSLSVGLFNEIVKTNAANFQFTGYGLGGAFKNEAGITPGNSTNNFIPAVGGNGGINALLSYFAMADYGYKGKYYLQATVRRDGSSRFGANKKYANFGSIGASWIVSDEDFMSGLKSSFLDELKFKVSYGSAGNQNGIGDFSSRELYGRSVYNGISGLVQNNLANPELQWERKTTLNAGFEFSTFKGRFSGAIEYYNSLTSDLFLNKQLSRTTGNRDIRANIGELQNTGVEASLNVGVIKSQNFNWDINASLTYNDNKIKKLEDGQNEIINGIFINRVGESLNSFYVNPTAGVNPANGAQQYRKLDGSITETLDADDRIIAGESQIPYFGGFGTTLSYKGFSLNTFFSFVSGNKIFNNDRTNVVFPFYYYDNLAAENLREWRNPGDITDVPRFDDVFESGTTRFVESGDFLRLRNATFSYQVPSNLLQKAKINSLKLFVQGQNIYTWHSFLGYDPEIFGGINNGAQYPALRTFTVGLNIGL